MNWVQLVRARVTFTEMFELRFQLTENPKVPMCYICIMRIRTALLFQESL